MKTVRILHTADWHIGAMASGLGGLSEARRYEVISTAEKIVELCNAQSVELLLIAGDIFDSNRVEKEFVDKIFDAFSRLTTAKVVIALGNHDPLTADSPFVLYDVPENVTVLPPHDSVISFDELGCRVYGYSFDGVYKPGQARFGITPPDDDFINILLLHGELKADLSGSYNPITPAFIKDCKMDYVALGHIHQNSGILKTDRTSLAYSGCPEGQGYDEAGIKGVYLGEVGKNEVMLDFVPTARRQYHNITVDITDCEDISQSVLTAVKAASQGFADDLFRITITGTLPEGTVLRLNEIKANVGINVYNLRLKDKTTTAYNLDILKDEQSVKGYFVKNMLEKISAADQGQKAVLENALIMGLNAFTGEVNYGED